MDKIEEFFGDWSKVINRDLLIKILAHLSKEYKIKKITPGQKDIFKAFTSTPLSDLKVVIIGQDPYPQEGMATGLAFANRIDTPISPSLSVIIDKILGDKIDILEAQINPTLEQWANQGVLLLNSSLTVEVNRPGSHSQLWREFIEELLVKLSQYTTGIIYVLLGKPAQSFEQFIYKRNYIIKCYHPAYYVRNNQRFECNMFQEIDKILWENNKTTIQWYEQF